jgi:hypothetical protein
MAFQSSKNVAPPARKPSVGPPVKFAGIVPVNVRDRVSSGSMLHVLFATNVSV